MKKVKLGDIADFTAGQSPKSNYYTNDSNHTPFMQGSKTFGRIYPTIEIYTSKITKMAKKGDILISVRAPVGDLNITNVNVCIGRGLGSLKSKKTNNLFIYYLLKNNIENIKKNSSGSTYSAISKDIINNLEFSIPNNEEDCIKIASILSLLDEKIETNAKIAKVLEDMMREIYNYWFVQFDFPDENGNPYKSSGGKMVWNEELNKEIPKEWKVKKLEDIFLFEKGTEVGSKEYKTEKTTNTIGFYRVQDMNSNSVSVFVNINNKLKIVEEKNVIVSFDGTVGKVDYGLNGAISSGLRHIYSPNQEYLNALVFNVFKDEKILETIKKYATGSNILHASGSIKHLNISFNEKYIKEFQNIIEPFFNQMVKLKQQNQTLSNLRDFLLPLLMNGQAEVL